MSQEHEQAPAGSGERSAVVEASPAPGGERVEVADEVVDAPHGWHGPGGWQPGPTPRPTLRQRLGMQGVRLGSLAMVAGIAWLIAPGGFHGGWFGWTLLGVILAPAVILGLAALVIGFFWTRMLQRERERGEARRAAAPPGDAGDGPAR